MVIQKLQITVKAKIIVAFIFLASCNRALQSGVSALSDLEEIQDIQRLQL